MAAPKTVLLSLKKAFGQLRPQQVFIMRHLQFIFIAFTTFLFAINAVFLRKALALIFCGIFSFNSVICYGLSNQGDAVNAAVPLSAINENKENQSTIDLTGTWNSSRTGFRVTSNSCTVGSPPATAYNVATGENVNGTVTIVQNGGQISIPERRVEYSGGSYIEYAKGTISGNNVSLTETTSVSWGFTNIYTGTVSADGKTVKGKIVCKPSTGSPSAEGTFTWTRKSSSKASPRIFFNGEDVTGKTQKVVVGQKIELTAKSDPESVQSHSWIVPGNTVGGYSASLMEGKTTQAVFTKPSTTISWTTPEKSMEIRYSYKLTNGQIASAKTTFDVVGPKSGFIKTKLGKVDIGKCDSFEGDCLRFGSKKLTILSPLSSPIGIAFDGKAIFDGSDLDGDLMWVQLANVEITHSSENTSELCKIIRGLDGGFPYPKVQVPVDDRWWLSPVTDSPQLLLDKAYPKETSQSMSARMYLMWLSKLPQSIPVPLGFVDWQWFGSATYDSTSKNWKLKNGEGKSQPYQQSLEYPTWTSIVSTSNYQCVHIK